MKRIMNGKHVMAAGWALLLYAPNLYAWYLSTNTGGIFSGSIVNIHDHNVYLGSVRDGMNGDVWIGNLLFTTEANLPQALNFLHASLFYRLLGWLYGFTGLPINIFYIAVGYALAFIAFSTYIKLFADCLESDKEVRIATALLFVFPGLLWVNQILQELPNVENYIPNNILFAEGWGNPSINPITHNYYMPHFVMANITVAILFRSLLHAIRDNRPNYFSISVFSFLAAWLLPSLGILWIAIVVTSIAYLMLVRSISQSHVIRILLSFVPSGLMSIWSYQLAFRSDFWAKYIYTNVMANGTIGLWLLIMHVGVLAPFTIWGAYKAFRSDEIKHFGHVLASIWLLWLLILAIGSFPGSPRFMDGLYLPVGILVSYVLSSMNVASIGIKKWLYATIILLVLPGTLITYIYPWYGHLYLHFSDKRLNLRNGDIWPIRLSIAEMETFRWIEDNVGMDDVVVAGPIFASFVPGFSGAKVYLGHIGRTIDFSQKLTAVQQINLVNRLPALDSFGNVWFVNTSHETIGTPEKFYTDGGNSYCSSDDFDLGDVSVLQYKHCN